MSFLDAEALEAIGFASLGRNVSVSRHATIYGAGRIRIGDHSRIDDFCVLSAGEGGIEIGRHVHVATMCSLIGRGRIAIADYCNLSSRVAIYSSSDDYSGEHMTNPTLPAGFTDVDSRPVVLEEHVIVGCGSVVLPGSVLARGVAVGALSLVKASLAEFGIYAGAPAKRVAERSRRLLELEGQLPAGPGEIS